MRFDHTLPETIREIPGLSDVQALRAEVSSMRTELAKTSTQMAFERELAGDIHRARSIAIVGNPTLSLVFDIENTDPERATIPTMYDMLSSAFVGQEDIPALPEGFVEGIAKKLRIQLHPDKGNDVSTAGEVAKFLEAVKTDPNFSVASALATTPVNGDVDPQELRDDRYRLSIALSGLKPRFEGAQVAKEHAEVEVSGAEWRIRTQAAFMSYELIVGDNETWNRFLQGIAQERHAYTIALVNRVQPEILSLQERIMKGDPKSLSTKDIEEVDAVFERVWSTLKESDEHTLPYSPPYHSWLEVLLPAMRILDPGQKPGEDYTYFEPPFQVQRATQRKYPDYDDIKQDVGKSIFDQKIKDYEKNDFSNEEYSI